MGLRLRLCCALVVSTLVWAQRADRATITGLVADPTGSPVAGASVKVVDTNTGIETPLTTNDAGLYTSPLLVLGNYTVTVEHAGFKSGVQSNIQLAGGQTYRVDMTLQLGAVSERVEVSAEASMVNTEQPDVANTVSELYYRDLPIIMGSDIRLAESLLQMQPGFTPMRPNGDPMFRGSQFGSRVNGGQAFAVENFFDGVAFGYAAGHQGSQESAPPVESVTEMRLTEGNYSAQYGHTSGGTVEYTSKSGTKDLHGVLYEYFANDALNARGFFNSSSSPAKQRSNTYGFAVGGPVVIPKIYNGRNRTFFFTNFDWLKYRSGVLPGFGNTTPIDAFKARQFQRFAWRAGRNRCARPASSRRSDLQPGNHQTGERCFSPRSLHRQYHSGERSSAEPSGGENDTPHGTAEQTRHRFERGGQSKRRPDLDRKLQDDSLPG